MKRGPGLLALLGLVLLLAGAAFLSIELLQRRRYTVVEEDITQAVQNFVTRAKPVWDAKSGKLRQAGPSEPATEHFQYILADYPLGGHRSKGWLLDTDTPDPHRQYSKIHFSVGLDQDRGFLLRSPRATLRIPPNVDSALWTLLQKCLAAHGVLDCDILRSQE